ncbi:hypothetical protein IM774_12225 [Erysipelotrichaceae bacterium RD49]|nr:hypothetical protein [Erysipelotrichaceae bacterium RD49]
MASISIKDLLAKTDVSRQTFYNHFLDKDDLICYIYGSRIIPKFDLSKPEVSFRGSLLESFQLMRKYYDFLRQPCLAAGPTSLKAHMSHHVEEFDLKWHQKAYGSTPDGSIWMPGDSKLLEEQLVQKEPDVILFDFSDDSWHITLEGAAKLANTYPNADLIAIHWGFVDAPTMNAFSADPEKINLR